MRLGFLVTLFMLLCLTSAHLVAITSAIKGAVALGTSVAKLATAVIPSGLLLPLAMLGPLKLSLPFLLGLKGIGLLKFKLLKHKAPLLIPIGVGAGKFGLFKAKARFVKAAAITVGKAKLASIGLPFKLTAMKIGAIAGAKAGAKAGLASVKTFPKSHFIHPMVIPASALLSQSKSAELFPSVVVPTKESSYAIPEAAAEEEEEEVYEQPEPVYGRKSSTTTTTSSTTTRRPAPAYTPEPVQASYRKRREAGSEATYDHELLSETFEYIQAQDTDSCVRLAVCEIAVDPSIAGVHGNDFMELMVAMDDSDEKAPWVSYKKAVELGRSLKSSDACRRRYDTCKKSTTTTVAVAKERLDSVEV